MRTSSPLTYDLSPTRNYKSSMVSALDTNCMDNLRESILHCMARFGKLARLTKVQETERDLPLSPFGSQGTSPTAHLCPAHSSSAVVFLGSNIKYYPGDYHISIR
ncbi:hypothetical protein NP493_1123g01062 [Ridgeia piscesae]|uniref:Uncharacterized protein n=1 Tax=Ridgeia piscesae TaxID=27915 RepID=A0AAD9NKW6_RIDPI|nr:hypothetical protein NP493_1123g01062 [Ridgeia piscesae]